MGKFCKTCVYCDKAQSVCRVYGISVEGEKDFCPKHAKELNCCEVCGQPMILVGSFVEQDSKGNWHQYCVNCRELLKTCQTCSKPCEFETNPDPMPKVVMKTVQQGNMRMQTQVMNPDRINKFCLTCDCYNEENGCKRQFNVGCNKKSDFWK